MDYLKRNLKYFLTVAFNVFLFYSLIHWFNHNIHLHGLWNDMTHIKWTSVLWVFSLDVVVSLLYALRLQSLLGVPITQAWSIVCIGNGLNNLLPFRLGDVARIYCAKQYYQIKVSRVIAATFIERYFDLMMLLGIGVSVVLFGSPGYDMTFIYILLILLSFGILSVLLYRMLLAENGWLRRWFYRFSIVEKFMLVLSGIFHRVSQKRIIINSLMIWLILIAIYYVFFKVNLVGVHLSFQSAAILCFTTTLAFAVPYVVAGIGVFESVVIYYLISFLHVPTTEAVALALMFHLVYALPQVLLMALIILKRKVIQRDSWIYLATKLIYRR